MILQYNQTTIYDFRYKFAKLPNRYYVLSDETLILRLKT